MNIFAQSIATLTHLLNVLEGAPNAPETVEEFQKLREETWRSIQAIAQKALGEVAPVASAPAPSAAVISKEVLPPLNEHLNADYFLHLDNHLQKQLRPNFGVIPFIKTIRQIATETKDNDLCSLPGAKRFVEDYLQGFNAKRVFGPMKYSQACSFQDQLENIGIQSQIGRNSK